MTTPASAPDVSFAQAVRDLWSDPPEGDRLTKSPAFQALLAAYIDLYPGAGSRQTLEFALRGALQRLGLGLQPALTWEEAVERLHRAACATSSNRLHLCPLDWAGDIPALSYGPNAVRDFTPDQLGELITDAAASPVDALLGLDLKALVQFRWLVVRETVSIASDPGARTLPALWINMGEDFGRIEPHRRRLPTAVEKALFCLLAIPWEDLTRETSADWRPFQAPWAYTVDDDLFTRRPSPPNPASLTWTYRYYDRGDGDVDEVETPLEIHLDDDAQNSATLWLDDEAWARFEVAEASALLTQPVMHFFLSGLLADGIDEFLAHVATIEASLGQASDHKDRATLPNGKSGATARTAWRLGQLLDDPAADETFRLLFKLRSRYVHGEAMSDISSEDRTTARRLARRCICRLVAVASSDPPPGDRTAWLNGLIPPPKPSKRPPAPPKLRG